MTDTIEEKQVTDAAIAEARAELAAESVKADTAKADAARASARKQKTQAVKQVEKANFVLYASASDEAAVFNIYLDPELDPIRGVRDADGEGILWRVPASLVQRFERHSMFVSGRIIRAE